MRDDRSSLSEGGKLKYEKPAVTRIGTLEKVTQHAATGYALDTDYPAGTPGGSLTFSD
jgi:hypothetical protein